MAYATVLDAINRNKYCLGMRRGSNFFSKKFDTPNQLEIVHNFRKLSDTEIELRDQRISAQFKSDKQKMLYAAIAGSFMFLSLGIITYSFLF